MGVYHKSGSNANDKTSIFDVSRDYVKKSCARKKIYIFSSKCHISDMDIDKLCTRTRVRISFHQQLHSKPHYALYIPDVR